MASFDMETKTRDLCNSIITALHGRESVSSDELRALLAIESQFEFAMRDAVWRLIDRKQVELTPDRRIRLSRSQSQIMDTAWFSQNCG